MNPKSMKAIGIVGGIVVTILTAVVFYRSFQAGSPNYKMLIMSCGMAFFLFFLAFSKTKR
ncbi:MAG: hypothetical protein AAFQ94_08325 [Bacteroidota bacterium]